MKKILAFVFISLSSNTLLAAICIKDIQGTAEQSPLAWTEQTFQAIVLHKTSKKAYVIDIDKCFDDDFDTNNAVKIEVQDGFPEGFSVGDIVSVTGNVSEFRPDFLYPNVKFSFDIDDSDPQSFSFGWNRGTKTETTIFIEEGNTGIRVLHEGSVGDSVGKPTLNLSMLARNVQSAVELDTLLERLEGNRVKIDNAIIAHPLRSNKYVFAVSGNDPKVQNFLNNGQLIGMLPAVEQIGYFPRFKLSRPSNDQWAYGQKLGTITGYIEEDWFGKILRIKEYIEPDDGGVRESEALVREYVPITKPESTGLTVATLNVKNLFDPDFDTKENKKRRTESLLSRAKTTYEKSLDEGDFTEHLLSVVSKKSKIEEVARLIVNDLHAPDIVALQEIQDNDGVIPSLVVSAEKTLKALLEALKAQDHIYSYHQHDPLFSHSTSGQRGGNIRNAFLVKDASGITVTKLAKIGEPKKGCTREADPYCAGRFPLLMDVSIQGQRLSLINVHLKSNFKSDVSEARKIRTRQMELLKKVADNSNDVVVLGDFNDDGAWEKSVFDPLTKGMHGLVELELPDNEKFTHAHQGTFSQLDHVFVSKKMEPSAKIAVAHFATLTKDAPTDHDGLLVLLDIK